MYNKKVTDKLKFLINLYEKRLYRNQEPYKAYLSLCGLDDVYYYKTGNNLFNEDKLKNNSPIIYRIVKKEEERYHTEYKKNILSLNEFTLDTFPCLLEVLEENKEILEREPILEEELSQKQWVDIINDVIEDLSFKDKDFFNRMILDYRVIKGLNRSAFGDASTVSDYYKNKDFIYIGSSGDNNENAIYAFHENGHVFDELNMPIDLKINYEMLSVYTEVCSYYFENKGLDRLIERGINKEEAISFKISLLYDLNIFINDYLDALNNNKDDIERAAIYSLGLSLALYFCNSDLQEIKKFDNLHCHIYDSKLLEEMDINKDKMVKCLKKEIEKIR